jgi:hypothetical protein
MTGCVLEDQRAPDDILISLSVNELLVSWERVTDLVLSVFPTFRVDVWGHNSRLHPNHNFSHQSISSQREATHTFPA